MAETAFEDANLNWLAAKDALHAFGGIAEYKYPKQTRR
jgi:hypothetical protein